MYTVKSGKSIGSDKGKNNYTRSKRSIVIWDVDNSQLDCNDDRRSFVAMTANLSNVALFEYLLRQ